MDADSALPSGQSAPRRRAGPGPGEGGLLDGGWLGGRPGGWLGGWVGAVAIAVGTAALIATAVPQRSLGGASPATVPTPPGPTTPGSVPPSAQALDSLLPPGPGPGFLDVPTGLDRTGPIDAAHMTGGAAAGQALLTATGFLGGYKKAWQQGTSLTAFAYVYDFRTVAGASSFTQAYLLGYQLHRATEFDVAGRLPGAHGLHLTVTTAGGASQHQTRLILTSGQDVFDFGLASKAATNVDRELTDWIVGQLTRYERTFT